MILNGALNLVLLFTVLIVVKKKPYRAALLFAAIKSVLNFLLLRSSHAGPPLSVSAQFGVSLLVGLVYAGLASAFMYFFVRMSTPAKAAVDEVPSYKVGAAETVSFRWEILPLIILLLLLLLL